jgi:dihydroflavonol-4-reductase
MYFTSARAERELGHRARPARDALAAAIEGFRAVGML